MQQNNYDYQVKIVLIGILHDLKINKDLHRWVNRINTFNLETKTTIGVEFGSRDIVVDANVIRIQLWDTAGQEKFQSITQGFYRNTAGVFLVYDITRKETFDDIQKWLKECQQMCNEHTKLYLLGNKTDLTNMREVSKLQARSYAEENNMLFGECSALDGEGIEQNLQRMMSEIYETMMKEDVIVDNPLISSQKKDSISLKNGQMKSKNRLCCYLK